MPACVTTFVLAAGLLASVGSGPDTVVVIPAEFVDALRPWITHRQSQGHRVVLISNTGSAAQIRAEIREHARSGQLKFILLVGDAEPTAPYDPRIRARTVPTHMARAKVNVRWRSTTHLPTDNWYADLDGNRVPDVAIGRLPADSPQDLSVMVAKILAYETSQPSGAWSKRINLVAGLGGFGPFLDPILELATKKFLTDGIPAAYDTSMTYGNWRSPFCPSPFDFHATTIQQLNEGCLFWVYMGHGYPYQLDRVHVAGRSYHILDTSDTFKLNNYQASPIAIFLACYTGAYDQPYDCLAEQLLGAPGGPVAVLAGSRVTMPYAMAVFGSGLMEQYFQQQRPTLGEVILHAKRQMVSQESRSMNRKIIDLLAAAISPTSKLLREERQEHVELFNLLGDPLLRLRYAEPIELQVANTATAGSHLEVRGTTTLPGRCTVELVNRRDRLRLTPPKRNEFDASYQAQTDYNKTHREANDLCWTSREIETAGGEFLTAVQVPLEARGNCHVRVFLEGSQGQRFALGAADIVITAPTTDSTAAKILLEDETGTHVLLSDESGNAAPAPIRR